MNVSVTREIDQFPWQGDFATLEIEAEGDVEECSATSPYGNSTATDTWTEVNDVTVKIVSATYGPDCLEADAATLQGLQAALDKWLETTAVYDSILEDLQCQV